MVNTVISGATLTTPLGTDKIPLSRGPSDPTPYYAIASAIAALGFSIANGLVATGTNQGSALLVSSGVNIVITATAPTACILPGGAAVTTGIMVVVNDDPSNALTLFPPIGGKFTTQATNASITIPVNGLAWCFWKTGLNWTAR